MARPPAGARAANGSQARVEIEEDQRITGLRIALDGVIYSYQQHGGITRMLSSLLPRLLGLDDELQIELWTWTKLAQPLPEHRGLDHRRVRFLPPPRGERLAVLHRFLRRLTAAGNERLRRRAVAKSAADVWHATLYWRPPDWRGRVLTTVYDLKEEVFPEQGKHKPDLLRLKRDAILAADHVLCISETTRRDVVAHYGVDERRLSVVPLGVEPELYRPDGEPIGPEMDIGGPFILFVGRRDRFKNFDLLMAAYRRWRLRDDVRLVVTGPPFAASELQRLQASDLGESLVALPWVDEPTLARLYRSAEALIYPSLYEGFGLPLLEAMACGCPAVAARIPSSTELATDVAVFFDPTEPDSLVEAMEEAVTASRSSQRVELGIARSRSYSWDAAARATLATYRQVAG